MLPVHTAALQDCLLYTSAGTASEQEILQIAAACETASTHPIGVSIVSAAKDQNLVIEKPAEIEEISGKGIHARLSQGEVLCGNRKLLTEFNVDCGARCV